jgi:hypothetical protein
MRAHAQWPGGAVLTGVMSGVNDAFTRDDGGGQLSTTVVVLFAFSSTCSDARMASMSSSSPSSFLVVLLTCLSWFFSVCRSVFSAPLPGAGPSFLSFNFLRLSLPPPMMSYAAGVDMTPRGKANAQARYRMICYRSRAGLE